MAQFTLTKRVAAPPAAVFAVIADVERMPTRIPEVKKVELLTPGPVGVGTKIKETRVMFGKEATEEMEITGFQRDREYTLECDSCGCHYTTVLSFREEAGGTRVTMKFGAVPQTLFARVMGFLMAPMMKGMLARCLKQDLADLKAKCEEPAT